VDAEFADEPRHRYRLQVIASDITAHRLLVLPRDAKRFFAIEPDDLDVAEATEFHLSRERATALHESGRRAAADFLDRWDFETYKATFRARRRRRAASCWATYRARTSNQPARSRCGATRVGRSAYSV
jgi:hypothetical protein